MRLLFLFILLICISLLGYAQYLQHLEGLLPCPLCVAQRLAYWLLGLVALLAFLHNPKVIGRRFYAVLMCILALIGTVIAARHAWLVRFPESFECGISPEEAFLNSLPLAGWWPGMFEANGDCADVDWKFLSLTIPDWSLIAFISLGIVSLYLLLAKK
ncbi:MAG: disulfide bond formation protein B [Pseudomonadota bacterium]